jgi:sigma-B regulation protein RsbU (phosphoserine phosphatase)
LNNGKGRLLVVGGAQPYLKSLSQRLDEAGHATTLAEQGPWAAARFASEPPELLLLDLRTPELDAPRFVAQVRADEALRDTPIILLAAPDDLVGVEHCLAAGAEDYLLAPISPTLLGAQVDAYLAISRQRQEARDRAQRETFLKMETDLQVAHRIQEGFLPKTLPQPAGWEVAANFKPAREVAGDFYDAFMLSQNRRMGFVIADVVDKGVPAALFMALVRSLTRAFAQQNYSLSWTNVLEDDPAARIAGSASRARGGKGGIPSTGTNALRNAVLLTNNYIVENHEDLNMFATLFFGLLDPSNGQLAYINAGHNPPFILGPDGAMKAALKGTGPAVGMFPATDFRIDYAQMDPGDVLYLYTDGVTEARDAAKNFFTEKRLRALLNQPTDSAAGLLERVDSSLRQFMGGAVQFDDITMMAVRRSPIAGA